MGWSGSRLTNLVGGVVSMRERVGWAAAAAFLVVVALLGSLWSNPSVLLANALNGEEILLQDETPIAIVIASYGNVSVIRDRGTPDERMMSPVKPGLLLFRGDQIWTGEDSWIEVEFEQTARVRVAPSSRVEVVTGLLREVDPETGEQLPTLRLWVGRVWVHVAEALSRLRNFSVETPSAIAGVRGTLFAVDVGVTGRTIVSVREGVVAVASPLAPRNEYLVGVGEEIEVLPEQEPVGPRLLGAEESRRWGEMQPWLKEQEEWKASRREQAQGGLFGFFSRLLRPGKEQGAEEGLEEPRSQAAGGTPASSGGGPELVEGAGEAGSGGDGGNSRQPDGFRFHFPTPVWPPGPIPTLPSLLSYNGEDSPGDATGDSIAPPAPDEPRRRDEERDGAEGGAGDNTQPGREAIARTASVASRAARQDDAPAAASVSVSSTYDEPPRERVVDADRGGPPGHARAAEVREARGASAALGQGMSDDDRGRSAGGDRGSSSNDHRPDKDRDDRGSQQNNGRGRSQDEKSGPSAGDDRGKGERDERKSGPNNGNENGKGQGAKGRGEEQRDEKRDEKNAAPQGQVPGERGRERAPGLQHAPGQQKKSSGGQTSDDAAEDADQGD